MTTSKQKVDVVKLFEEKQFLKVCAPMVRYSKVQFRTLVREYNCDLCYTPMILADSFWRSIKARNNEFTTNLKDTPLVVQFASNNASDFVRAALLAYPYCDGVDLNCGCPQRWAKQLGIGCALLNNPDVISDILKQCRNRLPSTFTVSVKMRLLNDMKATIELCKRLEHCGASYLTVHSRTQTQITGDINIEALALVSENVNCPIIANGGIKTLDDCNFLQEQTKCTGIMVANGLLTNPTLFSGSKKTTLECIQKWVDICFSSCGSENYNEEFVCNVMEKSPNLTFQCFHHHLVFMLEKVLPKIKRRIFNNLQNFSDVLNFLYENFGIGPKLLLNNRFKLNKILRLECERTEVEEDVANDYYSFEKTNGKYFHGKIVEHVENELDLLQLFSEH